MATSTFEKVSDGISHRLHDAVDFKDDAARELSNRIYVLGSMMKKHPLAAIGIGVGAGIGVGYLLARIIHRD
jgi:ElaB/YqjD/DUF883 family membrane-anchored ribosome-binding protein